MSLHVRSGTALLARGGASLLLALTAATTGCEITGFDRPASAKAKQVAVSGHSCALTDQGTVRCWGTNDSLQLGADVSKTTFNRVNEPVEVGGLSGVSAIAVGEAFSCALTTAGEVKCWGGNGRGQLGLGNDIVDSTSLANAMKPAPVMGIAGAKAFAVGDAHACALTAAGGVKCWGDAGSGQLGDGVELNAGSSRLSNKALDVVGLTSGVLDLAARGDLTCVVTAAHAVQCWGRSTSKPTPIAGFETGIDKVYVGAARGIGPQFVCAITSAGEAKCQGTVDGDDPVLGRGSNTTSDAATPTTVMTLTSGVTSMGLGDSVACAIVNGGVKCWGGNNSDQVLGVGDMPTFSAVPVSLPGLAAGATSVSVGSCNACAAAGGAALCWGRQGCVGNGDTDFATTVTYNTPQAVVGLP